VLSNGETALSNRQVFETWDSGESEGEDEDAVAMVMGKDSADVINSVESEDGDAVAMAMSKDSVDVESWDSEDEASTLNRNSREK